MPQIEQIAATLSSQVFWLLVFFGLTFVFVGLGMVPKIMGTVDLRDQQIAGDLAADSFLPWITRHMQRLGLRGVPVRRADGQVEITLSGPTDLIDAMEMGISLGPIDVWVEAISRQSLQNGDVP